jgi:hypothetical protein
LDDDETFEAAIFERIVLLAPSSDLAAIDAHGTIRPEIGIHKFRDFALVARLRSRQFPSQFSIFVERIVQIDRRALKAKNFAFGELTFRCANRFYSILMNVRRKCRVSFCSEC